MLTINLEVIILSHWQRKKTHKSANQWITGNAVCCHHNGERQDTRNRGGIKFDGQGGFIWHCFNCGFKTGFKWGDKLSFKTRQFLIWLGVDDHTIETIQLESLRQRTLNGLLADEPVAIKPKHIQFPEVEMPLGLELIDTNNPAHAVYVDYLRSRSVDPTSYAYLVTPSGVGRDKNKIVIPFTYKNQLVGNSARFIDDRIPKYIHSLPHGYAFGSDLQKPDWTRVIVVEGVFDALAIDGIATLHNDISEDQRHLINQLHREVIVVPDQDAAGMKMVDRAMSYGWAVSIPDWDADVKDVADAVKKYGKLGALITVIEAAETNPLKIKLKMKPFLNK